MSDESTNKKVRTRNGLNVRHHFVKGDECQFCLHVCILAEVTTSVTVEMSSGVHLIIVHVQ